MSSLITFVQFPNQMLILSYFFIHPSDVEKGSRKNQRVARKRKRQQQRNELHPQRLRRQPLPKRKGRRRHPWRRVVKRKRRRRKPPMSLVMQDSPNHWPGNVCRREISLRRANSLRNRLLWLRFGRCVTIIVFLINPVVNFIPWLTNPT